MAPTVFGGALALAKAPVTKVEDGARLRSQPHQDGGQAYGNAVNDYLMLMGDTPAEGGAAGESYLLDAMAILESLPERCASLALSPLPLIFSYKSEKSLCGAGCSG
eukprot:COSAG03_NODE_2518_length_2684_cov_3.045261_5_plen_105_part_01